MKQMRDKFGGASRTLRDRKYELEKTRDPLDNSPPWHMPHPDLPGDQDFYFNLLAIFQQLHVF